MTYLELNTAFGDYDRITALRTGDVVADGVQLQIACLEPSDIFARMCSNLEFDVAEMSMGAHMFLLGTGASPFVGVPAFPSRAYRHSMAYAHVDANIDNPADLNGKTIAIREWGTTALIWIIGILTDEYGFDMRSVDWVAARPARVPLQLPAGVNLRYMTADESISSLLDSRGVDAALHHEEVACFDSGSNNVKRVFSNHAQAEIAYHQRTGMHPIMHCVVMRADLHARLPWVRDALYDALEKSRQHAANELLKTGTLAAMIPFLPQIIADTQTRFGLNWWPYGLDANRDCLDKLASYAHAQGLTPRLLSAAEMFA